MVVTLQGSFHSIPYKSKNFNEPILARFKLDRGSRQTDLLFYTGPEFGTVTSFEMTAPFRLVLEFQKKESRAAVPLGAGIPDATSRQAAQVAPAIPALTQHRISAVSVRRETLLPERTAADLSGPKRRGGHRLCLDDVPCLGCER